MKQDKEYIENLKAENEAIKKAVWDILNYLNAFVVLLDKNMNIRLANWSLSTKLGFENEKDLINKCWLDFIKPEEKDMISKMYSHMLNFSDDKYKEVITEIISIKGKSIVVKWFNIVANHGLNMLFSIGVPSEMPEEENEDSVRAYYRDIIDKDKTLINSLLSNIDKFD
jgi:hypothetical protein